VLQALLRDAGHELRCDAELSLGQEVVDEGQCEEGAAGALVHAYAVTAAAAAAAWFNTLAGGGNTLVLAPSPGMDQSLCA